MRRDRESELVLTVCALVLCLSTILALGALVLAVVVR